MLEYPEVVCYGFSQNDPNLWEDIQIESARMIIGIRCMSSRNKLYCELRDEPLDTRRNNLHRLTMLYKILNGYILDYLFEIIEP